MTIKEIETLSAMERANIRFYEREGLIAPQRLENGYREYSQEDLQVLLRIKLLRSLHISLEEIKALKEGDGDLSDSLAKQIRTLEQEKQDVSFAQEVCRALQQERATFATLDAAKYLRDIDRTATQSGSPYFEVQGDVLAQVFHPWRRYLARMFDCFILEVIWSAVLALLFHVSLTARTNWGNILDSFVVLTALLFVEPLWLHAFGTTPGKAILGLHIEHAEGGRLLYHEGLERTWGVMGAGIGYNIPIYSIVRLYKSYKKCREQQMQPWDEQISYTIKDTKWYRSVLYIGACAVVFAVLMGIQSAQLLPPNRGDITVAQFAQNHRYYAEFFQIELSGEYLDENGEWVQKPLEGTAYFDLQENPTYHFDVRDGYIKGVSFEVEMQNDANALDWIDRSYDAHMLLSALSFVGAQKQVGLFSRIPSDIAKQIQDNSFERFQFTSAGVTVACDTEYSGYFNTKSGFLVPEENAQKYYCKISFSIELN